MGKKMISLEISDELREVLRVKAFFNHRSISKEIRTILEEQLKEELKKLAEETKSDINSEKL